MRVFLTNGDGIGWAIDEDRAHVIAALTNVQIVDRLAAADTVLAFWWAPLFEFSPVELRGKRVLCMMHGDPGRFLAMPDHRHIMEQVDLWITRSKRVLARLQAMGFKAAFVPYKANTENFFRVSADDPKLTAVRAQTGAHAVQA